MRTLLLLCSFIGLASLGAIAAPGRPPNVIILVAADMGYGDLGSYGNPITRTPHLDRLAVEGQRWTQFYSAAPVCTPSRGSLLTGRLPARLGLEGPAGGPNVLFSFSTGGLPHREITLAQFLRSAGYATALIGKWHLGYTPEHSATRHGFDEFFGTPSSNDHDPAVVFSPDLFFEEPDSSRWNVELRRNDVVIEKPAQQETLTQRFGDEAVSFIRRHRDRPFFLMVAYTMPHVPLFASPRFRGASLGGLYSDTIEEIDDSVGRVVRALEELRLDHRTLVVFTSDNGPIDLFRERGGSAGPLRGGKNTTWEGGMRVPAIFWGRGLVTPAIIRDLGSQLDLFATVAELARRPMPPDRESDGVSLAPTLRGVAPSPRRSVAFYRQGEIYAVRDSRFKAHFVTEDAYGVDTHRTSHDPPLVFDLAQDPGERFALSNPDSVLLDRLNSLRAEYLRTVPLAPTVLLDGVPMRPAAEGSRR